MTGIYINVIIMSYERWKSNLILFIREISFPSVFLFIFSRYTVWCLWCCHLQEASVKEKKWIKAGIVNKNSFFSMETCAHVFNHLLSFLVKKHFVLSNYIEILPCKNYALYVQKNYYWRLTLIINLVQCTFLYKNNNKKCMLYICWTFAF